MKRKISKLLLILGYCLVTQFVSAGPRIVLTGDYADPTIIQVDGVYYMTHSSFMYSPGLLIWKSTDLQNWTPVTYALQQFQGYVIAPDLVYHKNKFYIYYPASDGIFVITADKIEGPWSKPCLLGIPGIDPGHITDEKGTRYLYMSGGEVGELSADGLSVKDKKLTRVYNGWPIPNDWVVECMCLESPKLLFKDGYYHMFSAQGGTTGPPTSHMVVHARSKSVLGPWENSPINPIVHTYDRNEPWWSKGHGTVFQGPDETWWIVYHGYDRDNRTLGRNSLFEPVEWTSDGWLRTVSPTQYERHQMKGEALIERSDNFSGNKMGIQWQFWNAYEPERVKLENQSLCLQGKGKNVGGSSPLALIAGHSRYEVSVDVEIVGDAQAGLLLFYNDNQYIGTATNSKQLFAGERGVLRPVGNSNTKKANLRIRNDFNSVELFIDGKKVHIGIEAGGYSTHNFGGCLSLRPAIFCMGEGSAIFRNFCYEPLK
jgi:beta-xylosidase